jgi:hypothetical protein
MRGSDRDCKRLHNEQLHNLYALPNIVKVIKSKWVRLTEHIARTGETKNVYSILVGKSGGKRPLGRPGRRWDYKIGMNFG